MTTSDNIRSPLPEERTEEVLMPLASRPGFPFRDDDDPSREPTGSERGVTSRGFFRLASDGLCWLGGARPATLRYCPSEAGRFAGLGLAVLLTGCFGGAAATFATSFFLHKSMGRLWPVGLVWGIAIANIDRLLIMMAGTRRRLAITIPLRLLLAVPIGLLIAEIILLQIFQPEENGIINDRQQTQATQQIASIEAVYQPKITGDQTAITQLQQQIAGQAAQIEQNLEGQDEVDEAQVDAEKERLIAAAEGRPAQPAGRPTSSRQPPIPALSLSQFTGRARRHEGMATPIEVPLTRAAWIGTALLAALAAALLIAADVGHFAVTGAWIAFVGLALALGLAVYTHGFRRAPAWAQRGAFGIALAGLLLPPLIVLANV